MWTKSRRVVMPVTLTHQHILASSAIPIMFPPVQIASAGSELWFGDGGLRLVAPMSPAIRLGATHLLAVGVPENPPLARAGDEMAVEIDGIGRLVNRLVPETSPRAEFGS